MRKHQGKRQETVRKLVKHNVEGINLIKSREIKLPKQNGKIISAKYIYAKHRVLHTSACNNFPKYIAKQKICKVIVRYLAEISQVEHLTVSAKLYMLMITHQIQRNTMLKKLYRKYKKPQEHCSISSVCNFQSMKSPVELNSLLLTSELLERLNV